MKGSINGEGVIFHLDLAIVLGVHVVITYVFMFLLTVFLNCFVCVILFCLCFCNVVIFFYIILYANF